MKKFKVTYHLTTGAEVVDHVEAEEKRSAILMFGHDENKFVESTDGKLHKFNLKHVVMVTVDPI
ncbi:hypothetical protein [Jeotgalibacillus campisalis]|uniref:Uncharacterized protein n=1 Tax=Jeotgalibacillus campisalis TaxID=220754 RepID=A0A0C2VHP1_9BACL|nr:hypothetical protein [Jeotgalibacillus campisalis]KIL48397.1 hypothetical protein KR50_14330 [Jeotgalibacillus campisalis]